MNKVRWGVLSTAKIGMTQVLPAMRACPSVQLAAIASRSADSARQAAQALGMERYFDSYEALLADPDIDAVYIPLPNHLHVPWALKALEAGKHVLCEKPLGLSEAEAQVLLSASRAKPELKVMEAFMYRNHPQWVKAKEIIDTGGIGDLTAIQSFFSFYNDDPGNIRNKPEFGGGAMMDIGCYCISLSRWLFGRQPLRVFGHVERDPNFGTDKLFNGIMDFGGKSSTFACSTQLQWHQRVFLLGGAGSVELPIPFNAPTDRPTTLVHRCGDDITTHTFKVCDQYGIQGESFSRAILDNTPVPTSLEDAVENMHVLERLMHSADQHSWADC